MFSLYLVVVGRIFCIIGSVINFVLSDCFFMFVCDWFVGCLKMVISCVICKKCVFMKLLVRVKVVFEF